MHLLQASQKVQMLQSSTGQGAGEVLCDVNTKEFGAFHSLHCVTIDTEQGEASIGLSEVSFRNQLFCLTDIKRKIIVLTPD